MCLTHTLFETEKQQQEIVEISLKKRCGGCDDFEKDDDFALFGFCRRCGIHPALDHICTLEPKTGG
jgi:hypothetical protein